MVARRSLEAESGVQIPAGQQSFAKATELQAMNYCYILLSKKSHSFYFGSAKDLILRLSQHNAREVKSTKAHAPWKLVWYSAFPTLKEARQFEKYLKSGSGKSFAYKRLLSIVLAKDFESGRIGSPKTKS